MSDFWMNECQICTAFYFFEVFSHWGLRELLDLLKKRRVSQIFSPESCTSIASIFPSFQDYNKELLFIRYLYKRQEAQNLFAVESEHNLVVCLLLCDISHCLTFVPFLPERSCNSAELHKRSFLIAILKFFNIHPLLLKTKQQQQKQALQLINQGESMTLYSFWVLRWS